MNPHDSEIAYGSALRKHLLQQLDTLVRRRVVSHLHEALTAWQSKHVRGQSMRGTPADFQRIRTVLASYRGHLSHANTYRLRRRLRQRYPWLVAAARPPRFSHRLHGRRITIRSRR